MDSSIQRLGHLIAESQRILVFSGAGVSTESGIPDFRGPNGLWKRYAPIPFQDFLADSAARQESWRRGRETYRVIRQAHPNPAHLAIVELERMGRLVCLVTQNVDGLHRAAGNSPELILELHGNTHKVRCLSCSKQWSRDEIDARLEEVSFEPRCDACGGFLKPATISFGQAMPQWELAEAERQARDCDLCLVVGSSLVVYPAAAVPELAAEAGRRLAIINNEPTHLDSQAEVVLREQAGACLPLAVSEAKLHVA